MIANVIRVLIALAALATVFVTPLFREGPDGRQLLTDGVVIDLIAVSAIAAVAIWWWRSR